VHALHTLGHRDARFAIDFLLEAIEQRGEAAVIAVADVRGEIISILRMDGAGISSLQIAQNKAFTAARLGSPSKSVGQRVRHPEDGHDINYFGDPRYIGWGGGIPVVVGGECIGAVAVSGLPEEVDIALCQATVDKLAAYIEGSEE
jgi:glc operon protein GlcG